jgi:PAS domain S-box-containing protein
MKRIETKGMEAEISVKPVQRRLLVPLVAVLLLLLVGGFATSLLYIQQAGLEQSSREKLMSTEHDMKGLLENQCRALSIVEESLLNDGALVDAIKEQDRNRLLAHCEPLLAQLQAEYGITHFYFHHPDRVNFLRVHSPQKSGDLIDRFTAQEAERTGQKVSGIELGPLGTFTLRVVRPIIDGDTLIGYLELGKEIEDILQNISGEHGLELSAVIRKSVLERENWEAGMTMLGRVADWDRFATQVLTFSTLSPFPAEASCLVNEMDHLHGALAAKMSFGGRTWRVMVTPLTDASGVEVGDLVIFHDVSEATAWFCRLFIMVLGGTLMLLIAMIGILYILLRRIDSGISLQQTKLKENEEQIRSIVETVPGRILNLDRDGNIIFVNRVGPDSSMEEVIGTSVFEYIPPEYHQVYRNALEDVMVKGDIVELECLNIPAGSTLRVWNLNRIGPISRQGEIIGVAVALTDITKQKERQHRDEVLNTLHEEIVVPSDLNRRMNLVTEALVSMVDADFARIWLIDKGDRCQTCECAHVTEEQHRCKDTDKCLHLVASSGRYTHLDGGHARVPFDCYKIGLIASGKSNKLLTNAVTTDARIHNNRWAAELGLVSFGGYRLYDMKGETIGVMAMFADYKIDSQLDEFLSGVAHTVSQVIITDQIQRRLQQSEERLQLILESVQAGVIIVDQGTHEILSVNPAAAAMAQMQQTDMIGHVCHKVLCPEEQDKCPISDMGLEMENRERELVRADGEKRIILKTVKPIVLNNKNCLIETFVDISKLKEAEKQLQAYVIELKRAKETALSMMKDTEKVTKKIETTNEHLVCETVRANEMAAQAKQASMAKSQFLANMSHELRTPLNSLLILAQDLQANHQKNLTDEQVECAGIIYNSGEDLLELINDILDLAKVEAGKISLTLESVALTEIVEAIYAGFDRMIEEHGLSLTVQVDTRLSKAIQTDRMRLNQVIKNLISNAIKFTPKGGITVDIHVPNGDVDLSRSGLHHTEALGISVIDTGIGLPVNKQKEIFEAFQQADGSTSRKYGGTGLGLSISREVSQMLGGEIHLESEEGKGSTFTVYVPTHLKVDSNGQTDDRECSDAGSEITQEQEAELVQHAESVVAKGIGSQERPLDKTALCLHQELDAMSDTAHQMVTELNGSDTMFSDTHILLVDDDMRNIFALSKILQDKGAIVYKAANGQKAIEILESEGDVDLVLMDMMMPIMDGYEAMRVIRANPTNRHLPIVALTAKAMKGDREQAIEAGANDYMSKPVDLDRLFSLIQVWLQK